MPDESFVFKGVKKTYQSYTQKISTLWPISRIRSLTDEDVIDQLKILQLRWRKRLEALEKIGWADLKKEGVKQFARNCPPVIAITLCSKAVRPCRLFGVCPFCHMRRVGELYEKLAALLPKRGRTINKALTLVEISGCVKRTPDEIGKYLSGTLRDWLTVPKRLISKLPVIGSFRIVNAAPVITTGQFGAYKLSYSILAIMPKEWQIPTWLNNGNRKIRLSVVQSRKELVNVVARTFRYPVGLMQGDSQMTMIALNAKRGKRCCEFTGCLRKSK